MNGVIMAQPASGIVPRFDVLKMLTDHVSTDVTHIETKDPASKRAVGTVTYEPELFAELVEAARSGSRSEAQEAVNVLVTISLDPSYSDQACEALLGLYKDPQLSEQVRTNIREQSLQAFKMIKATEVHSPHSSGASPKVTHAQFKKELEEQVPTAVLYLAGQRTMGAGSKGDASLEEIDAINRLYGLRLKKAPIPSDRKNSSSASAPDLVGAGRFTEHQEIRQACMKLGKVQWMELDRPVQGNESANESLSNALNALPVGGKPSLTALNVNGHWVALIALKKANNCFDFLIFDSEKGTERPALNGLKQDLKQVKGDQGTLEMTGGTLQVNSPNSCGPQIVRSLRMLDERMAQPSPSDLTDLKSAADDISTTWSGLGREVQRAIMVVERHQMLVDSTPPVAPSPPGAAPHS